MIEFSNAVALASEESKHKKRDYLRQYQKKRRVELNAYRREYYRKDRAAHPEKYKERRAKARPRYRAHELAYARRYRQNHRQQVLATNRKWFREVMSDPERKAKLRSRTVPYFREYHRKRESTDVEFRLIRTLRSRVTNAVRKGYGRKSQKTIDLIGCSVSELRNQLESQFAEGMSWDNYGRGGWSIDHIIPCSSFNMSDEHEQRTCFSHRNMQPMWESENIRKGAKMPEEWLAMKAVA